ncbi:hypothetical protein FRC10_001029 [Ceratobasidium sp. 414]|nr:hypothetical protein FRC10_001029 [Ceratobasidium sp. 414]
MLLTLCYKHGVKTCLTILLVPPPKPEDEKHDILAKIVTEWPMEPTVDESQLVKWVLDQLLVMSVITVSEERREGACYLPEMALKALCQRAETYSKSRSTDTDKVFLENSHLIHKLILLAGNCQRLSEASQTYLAISSAQELQALLNILGASPGRAGEVKLLLSKASQCPRSYFSENIRTFSLLAKIGRHQEYIALVSEVIRDIACDLKHELLLDHENASDFLNAVAFVLQPLPTPGGHTTQARAFVLDVFDVLRRGREANPDMLYQEHVALDWVEKALEAAMNEGATAIMLSELREMRSRHFTDLLGLREGLTMLFGTEETG